MATELNNIYQILDQLKIRRAMYLGNGHNFSSLNSFITGYTTAASYEQLESHDNPNFTYFSIWLLGHLKKHFGEEGGWYWQIINRNPENDEKCFGEFFQFLEIFKKSKTHKKSIVSENGTKAFRKSEQVKRFQIVDGKELKIHDEVFRIDWVTMDNSSAVWLEYIDKSGDIIRDFWQIKPREATQRLAAEFEDLHNDWTKVSNE
jgi:hypothetical protein